MENVKYQVSSHCKTRYAERVMGKREKPDAARFVSLNEDKIKTDINKMIEYGSCIYSGRQSQKDGKGKVIDVYVQDTWVLLVDEREKVVVTLYKIDLGLGDEFNNTYVTKMLDKLNSTKATLEDIQKQVQEESDMYRKMIEEADAQIKDRRSEIKSLEELREAYKIIINNNCVKVAQANKDVTDVLNKLIEKRVF
jgi:hypothetical protein